MKLLQAVSPLEPGREAVGLHGCAAVFKKFKKRAINPENYHDELLLADDEQQMFDMVYNEYNRFSAVALMNMTHTEGPWKKHDIGDVITNEELRAFFLTQIEAA